MEPGSAGVSRGLDMEDTESLGQRRVAAISTLGSYCWDHKLAAGRDNEGPKIRTNLRVRGTGAQQALGQMDRWIPATEGSPAHPLPRGRPGLPPFLEPPPG